MTTTSKDVARVAGVSQPTVSRALRDSPLISAETKARVRAAAEELGYIASQHGRQLRTRRSRRIAVLATELNNPFYMALLDPLHSALREAGYSIVVVTGAASSGADVDDLADGSFDGVLLTNCRIDSRLPEILTDRGIAAATLSREVFPTVVDSCAVANVRGATDVANEIVAAGHTLIAHIGGPTNTSTGRDRGLGFRRAVATAGLTAIDRRGEFTFETGFREMTALLALPAPPTAVFCGNDVVAIGALNAARNHGVRVPSELSIVGFDDLPMAAWPVVDLATMHCDLDLMARRATEFVVSRIDQPDLPLRREILEAQFIARASLARAPGR